MSKLQCRKSTRNGPAGATYSVSSMGSLPRTPRGSVVRRLYDKSLRRARAHNAHQQTRKTTLNTHMYTANVVFENSSPWSIGILLP